MMVQRAKNILPTRTAYPSETKAAQRRPDTSETLA